MPLMPVSYTACSPASSSEPSTSARALSTTSSIRPGWMRPSVMSRSRARRPTSRRTGSKHETTTVSGVSSMMTSTPVAASKARMFRPSRPMIRPFISSEGRATADTVLSAVAAGALLQTAESLLHLLLVPLDVTAPARRLLLEGLARLHQLLLGREDHALSGLPEQALGLRGGRPRRRLHRSALDPPPDHVEHDP